MSDLPPEISHLLKGLSKEELLKLKRDLMKPDKGKAPLIVLEIPITHKFRCRLCGRMWEATKYVSANTEDLPPELTIIQNTCFECEQHVLTHWDKGTMAAFLVAVAEHGIQKVWHDRLRKTMSSESHQLYMDKAGSPKIIEEDKEDEV